MTFEDLNIDDMVKQVSQKADEAKKKLSKLNILITGKTGVGKSTLINNVFSENLASTGIGMPVTQDIKSYGKENFPLTIYDTPGIELGGNNGIDELIKQISDLMISGIRSGDGANAIHCIWYCLATPSNRIEQAEIDFINKLHNGIKDCRASIILVMTQSYSKREGAELKQIIEHNNLPVVGIVPVLAQNYEIDEDYTAQAYGLDELLKATYEVLPQAQKDTLTAVQKVDLKMKARKAHAIVAAAAAGAAATGAIPIPVADAAVLVPEEVSMIASITAVYGFQIAESTMTSIVYALMGTTGATMAGKALANAAKHIPGYGTVIGAAISGTIAAGVSASLGETYIALMNAIASHDISLDDLEQAQGRKMINELFNKALKLRRDAKGKSLEDKYGKQ